MMTKIVYNDCYGGFCPSGRALDRYKELKGIEVADDEFLPRIDISRTDPCLVAVVEELGDAASAPDACLRIAEVPPGTKYRIEEHQGLERVVTMNEYAWLTA